ncbi:MAG: OmpA family protein [Ignavibacteriaceae bacterium]|nr:OmpA family protein [Ignavibacteriaceae bacterium]
MKNIIYLFIMGFAGLLVSCANVPPAELINARESYQQASMSQNAQLNPADLHKAEESLNIAEKSYIDDPNSYKTKDLAYVADRKAKTAEALGITAAENAKTAQANKEFQATQTEILKNTKENLASSEQKSSIKSEQLATEQQAHLDADNRAAKAQADLAALAAVKEDARGLVITLSGSVLFASDKSELLPAARDKLNQVADALLATKERKLSVDGYTDSQGSASYNMDLSQRRADAVRSYLITRGYPGELIQANGLGKGDPVADNSSPEGRADNRRVEIIVNHATVSQK